MWNNGPESSSKVCPETGIGPWMALSKVCQLRHGQSMNDQEAPTPIFFALLSLSLGCRNRGAQKGGVIL